MKQSTQLIVTLSLLSAVAGLLGEAVAAPKKPAPPPAGVYQVAEGMNRDYSMIQMKDSSGTKWPMFWLAHPRGSGSVDLDKGAGTFTLEGKGTEVELLAGSRQETKIGGELTRTETVKDSKGNAVQQRVGPRIVLEVQLTGKDSARVGILYNGKTVATTATVTFRPANPCGKGGVDITGNCQTTLRALGLGTAETPVDIHFWAPGRP